MKRRHRLYAATLFALVGCTPSADTDDANVNELIDLVVAREAPFHRCLEISGRTSVVEYPPDYLGPITGLHTGTFSDEELTLAAKAVAVSLDEAIRLETAGIRVVGEPDTVEGSGSCALQVGYPLFSQEYAFVEFSTPSGIIGAYAFKRSLGGWRTAERFHFGYW
ncbi:hypothetical protein [Pelagerythrobacter rhizovicinus]|uniref:Uncharacterized protein n=1 Tax=Pelagerythrobacter rhizovicinus TaxID=2268576 RepID=A0A4Q2KJB6_9SPHN|nr:hypothetical protein [Pelagerythrobacter rhizovicinus]RXZ64449.1 hypothetical protein ETX26_11175 [Pelagerythrobacter rhizovicinus]